MLLELVNAAKTYGYAFNHTDMGQRQKGRERSWSEIMSELKTDRWKTDSQFHDSTVNEKIVVDAWHITVKPRYTGPKNTGYPPITNAKLWSLQVISFNFLYWQ